MITDLGYGFRSLVTIKVRDNDWLKYIDAYKCPLS